MTKNRGNLISRHVEYVKKFNSRKNLIPRLNADKKTITDKIMKYEAHGLKNLTFEESNKYHHYKSLITDIDDKIMEIDMNNDENNYYINSSTHLMDYAKNTQVRKTNKKYTKDMVANFIDADAVTFQKGTCLNNYLMAIDDADVVYENPQDNISQTWECEECGSAMEMYATESVMMCQECGLVVNILVESEIPSYKEPPPENTHFVYKRINHLKDWLTYLQAKENTEIAKAVLYMIKYEMKKMRITTKKLTGEHIKRWLSKYKKSEYQSSKYYEHIPYILYLITGRRPLQLTPQMEEDVCCIFGLIQEPYEMFMPSDRKNFMSYPYVIHKIYRMLGYGDKYIDQVKLLKSNRNLHKQDKIWKKICHYHGGDEAGWVYESSF